MRIAIRTDASSVIGSGHVMRCLTLAQGIRQVSPDIEIFFICRNHQGSLIAHIESQGFLVSSLSPPSNQSKYPEQNSIYERWLGDSQSNDAADTISILRDKQIDWLIIDHYAIDEMWEKQLRAYASSVMVIDDLAERKHDCDVLLDQTLGRTPASYEHLVPEGCRLLLGTEYVLLRPEFLSTRKQLELNDSRFQKVNHILISLGGVDRDNLTKDVILSLDKGVKQGLLASSLTVTVVLGAISPHVKSVQALVEQVGFKLVVKTNVSDMAELMAQADLAIGAAGATSWERCCLGLPTILFVLAENQEEIARQLVMKKVVWSCSKESLESLPESIHKITGEELRVYSRNAMELVDGCGVDRVVKAVLNNG